MGNALEVYVYTEDYRVFEVAVKKFKTGEELRHMNRTKLTLDEAWEYADGLCEDNNLHIVSVMEGSR